MTETFQLFTSIRHDASLCHVQETGPERAGWNFAHRSPLYMLDYHRDRMLRAAFFWDWQAAVKTLQGEDGISRLVKLVESSFSGNEASLRVKILLSPEGHLSCEAGAVSPVPLENLFPTRLPPPDAAIIGGDPSREPLYEVLVDTERTPRSEHTHFKTTWRQVYDGARTRAALRLTDEKEVLLVNENDGSIMEGSISSPYFWRNGRWVTPPVPSSFSWEAETGGQDGTTRRWALERSVISIGRSKMMS